MLGVVRTRGAAVAVLLGTGAQGALCAQPDGILEIKGKGSAPLVLFERIGPFVPGSPGGLRPLVSVVPGDKVHLGPGLFLLTNACSWQAFEHRHSTQITVPEFEVAEGMPGLPSGALPLECTDPVTGEVVVLPPSTRSAPLLGDGRTLRIGGGPAGEPEGGLRATVYPVRVRGRSSSGARYFARRQGHHRVFPSSLGEVLWLWPGTYELEVNGSARTAEVGPGRFPDMDTGTLLLSPMPLAAAQTRMRTGGGPVFATLAGGALLGLGEDTPLFPGTYSVNLEGSEIEESFVVEAGARTVVPTVAAVVTAPSCPPGYKSCRGQPRITIHQDGRVHPLMTVPAGLPFLLFDSKYQFGVEGSMGILRSMATSRQDVLREQLGRVRLLWEPRLSATRSRTDLVRIESKGGAVTGKSLDLLFSKPEEVYLPSGKYQLTYFVGEPSAERQKTRYDFVLRAGETTELVVPVEVDRASIKAEVPFAEPTPSGTPGGASPQGLPGKLTPLRR